MRPVAHEGEDTEQRAPISASVPLIEKKQPETAHFKKKRLAVHRLYIQGIPPPQKKPQIAQIIYEMCCGKRKCYGNELPKKISMMIQQKEFDPVRTCVRGPNGLERVIYYSGSVGGGRVGLVSEGMDPEVAPSVRLYIGYTFVQLAQWRDHMISVSNW